MSGTRQMAEGRGVGSDAQTDQRHQSAEWVSGGSGEGDARRKLLAEPISPVKPGSVLTHRALSCYYSSSPASSYACLSLCVSVCVCVHIPACDPNTADVMTHDKRCTHASR